MLLNFILLIIVIATIILLFRELKKPSIDNYIMPECNFVITRPRYKIENDTIRIAKFSVLSKNKNRYFRDFPIGFRFYSDEKFRSKIRISYNVSEDDDIEIIYDRVVEFEEGVKEHIYYINDVIMGSIDIEIYTDTYYGKPSIDFEILQNNMCHLNKVYKIEIKFPN